MKGNEVIENGDVLVNGARIAAVGAAGTLTVPAGTKTIDVTGKTIIPGWVDIHAHMWPNFGIHRTQVYEYLVNLAYGVTTTRDPQTSTTDVLSYSDLVETGAWMSTQPGMIVFPVTSIVFVPAGTVERPPHRRPRCACHSRAHRRSRSPRSPS